MIAHQGNTVDVMIYFDAFSVEELQEGSKALHDVLQIDLPKVLKGKPKTVSHKTSTTCDRCGRDLYGSS